MSGAAVPEVDFTDAHTIRLISTAHIDEPALAPLADDAADLAILEELEAQTSSRRSKTMPLPAGLAAEELLSERAGYGWTYVNAAFCYTRPGGNRFNGPDRGAWYAGWGADAAETTQTEIAWHLTRELQATGVFDNMTAYRELIAGFTTRFHDLSGYDDPSVFNADPAIGYTAGQALARRLFEAGSRGVLYTSVRRAGGRCLAAFHPHSVQNVRQGETWLFTWSGKPEPAITRAAGAPPVRQ